MIRGTGESNATASVSAPVKRSVLIVDDSVVFRTIIRRALDGCPGVGRMEFAHDGRETIDRVRRRRPDVITSDMEMPRVDGVGVLNQLGEDGNRPPVILVSGHIHTGSKRLADAIELGADEFVLKPATGRNAARQNEFESERRRNFDSLGERSGRSSRSIRSADNDKAVTQHPMTATRDVALADPRIEARLRSVNLICIAASTGGAGVPRRCDPLPKHVDLFRFRHPRTVVC